MTASGVRMPIFQVGCDADRCFAKVRRETWLGEWHVRQLAEEMGWQVRPSRGKGSRNGLDLCPDHKPPMTTVLHHERTDDRA